MARAMFGIFGKLIDDKPPTALEALNAHMAADRALLRQIDAVTGRLGQVQRDIQTRNKWEADAETLRKKIDAENAEAHYNGQEPPDLSDEKNRLKFIDGRLDLLAGIVRHGHIEAKKSDDELAALQKQRAELKANTDRLLWEAVKEEADSHLAPYLAARTAMIEAAHKYFAACTAADTIAKARAFGQFCGSGLYNDLLIPIPDHHSIQKLTVEASRAADIEDRRLLNDEAEDLINEMLTVDR